MTETQRLGVLSAALALATSVVAGCKQEPPGPGDPCEPKDIRCVNAHTELACQSGTFIAAPCKGPKGCREGQSTLLCDITGNSAGDVCSTGDEGNAKCISDGRKWIICRGGKYAIEHCRGEKGCHQAGTLRCDQSKAAEGDACARKSNACNLDGSRVLTCKDGQFRATARCSGPAGCSVVDKKVQCDLGKKDEAEPG